MKRSRPENAPHPHNSRELSFVSQITAFNYPHLVDMPVTGNPVTQTLHRTFKNTTNVRMVHETLPLIQNNISSSNNTLYFTEIYVNGATPLMWRTKIAPGMYSASQLGEALQAAMQAAVPVVETLPGPTHVAGDYTVLYDDVTSRFGIKSRSAAVVGVIVHPAPARAEMQVSLSLGTSEAGRTRVHVTPQGVTAHNLSIYAVLELYIQSASRVTRVPNCMISRAPTTRSFVVDLDDSELAGVSRSDEVTGRVTVACSEDSVAATLGYLLPVTDPEFRGTVASILCFAPTETPNRYVFSLDRPHFLEVGETVALDTGQSLVVQDVGSSTVVTASSLQPLTEDPRGMRARNAADGGPSTLTTSSKKADLTLNLRAIYVELVLGKQVVGRLQSSRFGKRVYMSKVLMDGDPNSIVFQTNAKATVSDVDVPLGLADFNTVRLTLYDALENKIDFNDVSWSCVLEFFSRE